MRRGTNPSILFDKKGRIFAITTGSDACAEHETGSNAMQRNLASGYRELDWHVENLKKTNAEPSLENTPTILEMKTIDRHDGIVFTEGMEGDEPFATICTLQNASEYSNRQMERCSTRTDCTGAWDEEHFGFRVYGEKLVKKLREFYQGIKEGDAFFAGLLLNAPCFKHTRNPSGVMVARKSMLRPEHREYLETARSEYLDKTKLKFRSRANEIHYIARKNKVDIGYIWPVWKDESKESIVYGINSSYEFQGKIAHCGPYEYEDIVEWIQSDRSQKLKNVNETANNKRKLK